MFLVDCASTQNEGAFDLATLLESFANCSKAADLLRNASNTTVDPGDVSIDLKVSNINETFAAPETLSFWDLRGFIENLDKAGFSALRHRLYWHSLLAAPLLLCAMVLIAATFTLKQSQRSSTSYLIVGGIMSGFLLFFFSDVVFALGLRESIPVVLAAWTPSGVSALLGLAMVFHLEDG